MKGWRGLAVLVVSWAVATALVATAPAAAQGVVTATCTSDGVTAPCGTGWYTSAVSLVWSASPPPDSTSGCSLGIKNHFDSDSVTGLSCTAVWGSLSDSLRFPLHVEVSTPRIVAIPSRPPDSNGWYNHPLSVSFHGSSFSGIGWCTPTTAYVGPTRSIATVKGGCVDNAGKPITTSFPLRFDTTPPSLAVASFRADRTIRLNWRAGADIAPIALVTIVRTSVTAHPASTIVYAGSGNSFTDKRVRNGIRYRYAVTARDQAGNATARTIELTPGPHLLGPAPHAHLAAPPQLSWTSVRRATYYNVQLLRSGKKILSAWPKGTRFRLPRKWAFEHHHYRLRPGRYRWYVWPGFGKRAAGRYGRVIGHGTFTITAA
jgi:hypothetical protein